MLALAANEMRTSGLLPCLCQMLACSGKHLVDGAKARCTAFVVQLHRQREQCWSSIRLHIESVWMGKFAILTLPAEVHEASPPPLAASKCRCTPRAVERQLWMQGIRMAVGC